MDNALLLVFMISNCGIVAVVWCDRSRKEALFITFVWSQIEASKGQEMYMKCNPPLPKLANTNSNISVAVDVGARRQWLMSYDFDCQTKKVVSCSCIPFSILIADFMVIHDYSYKALEDCNQNNFHISLIF